VLGFCFSFPLEQTARDSGTLIKWVKGFENAGVEGRNVVELLQDAFHRKVCIATCWLLKAWRTLVWTQLVFFQAIKNVVHEINTKMFRLYACYEYLVCWPGTPGCWSPSSPDLARPPFEGRMSEAGSGPRTAILSPRRRNEHHASDGLGIMI